MKRTEYNRILYLAGQPLLEDIDFKKIFINALENNSIKTINGMLSIPKVKDLLSKEPFLIDHKILLSAGKIRDRKIATKQRLNWQQKVLCIIAFWDYTR